jgi:hypothetical protein
MEDRASVIFNFHEKVSEINKKINDADEFDSALYIAAEELKKILEADRIQILLHRTEQNS